MKDIKGIEKIVFQIFGDSSRGHFVLGLLLDILTDRIKVDALIQLLIDKEIITREEYDHYTDLATSNVIDLIERRFKPYLDSNYKSTKAN